MDQVSIGYVVGFILAGIVALITIGLTIAAVRVDRNAGEGIAILSGGLFVAGIIALITAFPFGHQYHYYTPVEGKIVAVNSRLLRTGDGDVSQKFAVKLENGKTYGCEDTRCSVWQKGDTAKLMCIRDFQWRGVSGYNCKYNGEQ
jgi:hypothetical protein